MVKPQQLELLSNVFSSGFGTASFLIGLALSIGLGLWIKGKQSYWIMAAIGSSPVALFFIVPLMIFNSTKPIPKNSEFYPVLLLLSIFASPFAIGVLCGGLLTLLALWSKVFD